MSQHGVQTLGGGGRLIDGPFAAAVVIPTVGRASLVRAVRSIFAQDLAGSIQILIGIDQPLGDGSAMTQIERECPGHCLLTVFDLGYSTSVRHGGLHPARDGGVLRTLLSYAAHSRYVAYLDDDNWWAPNHLSSLRQAITGVDWSFALRWYADAQTQQPLCVDEWESLGPYAGCFRHQFGGFVDPNGLMIDKLACEPALRWWSVPLPGDTIGMSADRNVQRYLREHHRWRGSGLATVYYTIHPSDTLNESRRHWIASKSNRGVRAETNAERKDPAPPPTAADCDRSGG